MVIFNSYVKLPDGKCGKCGFMENWETPPYRLVLHSELSELDLHLV